MDADAAPSVAPEAQNPDAASDAELAARAAALVAALRNSGAQAAAAKEIKLFATCNLVDKCAAAHLRRVDALSAAGAVKALLELVRCPDSVGVPAADALNRLMFVSDTVLRAVIDTLGVDTLVQMLHDSQGERRIVLVLMLNEFKFCDYWMASLSPDADNNLVSRILALPLLKSKNPWFVEKALSFVLALVKQHPSFGRAVVPSASLLAECLLGARLLQAPMKQLLATACELIQVLQAHDGADFVTLSEANVYVACVDVLGALFRYGECSSAPYAQATRVLSTAYARSVQLRQRIRRLIFSCSGALAGTVLGAAVCANEDCADARLSVSFLNDLCLAIPGNEELVLVDSHFAFVVLRNEFNYTDMSAKLETDFISQWRSPESLRALAQPLQHQKLAAAVLLACFSSDSPLAATVEFSRILVGGNHLETLVSALLKVNPTRPDTASGLSKASLRDFTFWQEQALRLSVFWLVGELGLSESAPVADSDDAGMAAGAATKRARTSGPATLRASDVNVQRRDSTILLIADRPFYVFGALIETKSAVLADALRNATTLDPVSVPLPNEVPAELQYDLFRAAVEHAYTGSIALAIDAELLLPLWCLGDFLQMEGLCTWCAERMAPVLSKDAALLERAWSTAIARPSDVLCDACALAWLVTESNKQLDDTSMIQLLKRVHDGCATKTLVVTQLARVLRKALLARIAQEEEDEDEDEDGDEDVDED